MMIERIIYLWVVHGRFFYRWMLILLLVKEAKSYSHEIKPEEAVNMLRERGLNVSLEQAREILELLYVMATLEVKQHLKNEDR